MVTIRAFQPEDDLSELIALSKDFFAEYAGHHPFFAIGELRDQPIADYFASFLHSPDRVAFIALEEDVAVGYITVYVRAQEEYWLVRRVGHISGLMMRTDRRGRGIGRALMEAARDFFRERGATHYTRRYCGGQHSRYPAVRDSAA